MISGAQDDNGSGQEQTEGHGCIRKDVIHAARNPSTIRQPRTTHHVTDLCNNKVGQHFLNVRARQSQKGTGNNRYNGHPNNEFSPNKSP